jgi:HAD superfamily hydrolase (TIGR01509 family)
MSSSLERIDARDVFDRVYGSDLVNSWKFGPAYYRAVLADSAVDPRLAAVVDDSPAALSSAASAGCVASSWTANTRKTSTTR